MKYNLQIQQEAQRTLAQRREQANRQAAALAERMRQRYPRVREIEAEMAQTSAVVIRAVLGEGRVEETVQRMKEKNLSLQAELAALLEQAGEKARDFEPRYTCPFCRDTGRTEKGVCTCYQTLLREIACRKLCEESAMRPASLEEMSLAYYPETAPDGSSPRARMKEILTYCRRYAADFSERSPSLILRGPTGTGKTHASLAIARAAAEKGYHVIYGPIQRLLHQLEKEHFGKEEGESEELLCRCDLLILDDLGAEFTGSFYTACLYNVLNARLLQQFPTIISTNLTMPQIRERYGDAIVSRIMGSFQPLPFCGQDIRQLKMQQLWQ